MTSRRATSPPAALGRVGLWLNSKCSQYVSALPARTEDQWRYIDSIGVVDPLGAGALSVLHSNIPFQVDVKEGKGFFSELVDNALVPIQTLKRDNVYRVGISHAIKYANIGNDSAALQLFPGKDFNGFRKVNIHFSQAWRDLVVRYPAYAADFNRHGSAMIGFYSDQASAALMYAVALAPYVYNPVSVAIRMVADPTGAKELSTVLKALGLNGTQVGAVLCEANTLQGRGVGTLDLMKDALARCKPENEQPDLARIDPTVLRSAIREVLVEEIDMAKFVLPTEEAFWTSRWLWCVNGSHSRTSERLLTGHDSIPSEVKRTYRKNFVEANQSFSLDAWCGRSNFVPSVKLEHGKSRAIYGGDTHTYLAFEYLLRPVEKAWRHYRVVLNPGYDGSTGMCYRIDKLRHGSGINIMMDYDNFNSAHTLANQAIVFEELCEFVGFDRAWKDKLCNSFNRSTISFQDGTTQKLQGSLMSGHRATSFINSVLNRAYLLSVAPRCREIGAIHVGDDVFMTAPDLETAAAIMDATQASGLKMNKMKQSVGFRTSEFLRIATGPTASYGYVARAIASAISGNWVSELQTTPAQALESVTNSAWSIMNRCGHSGPVELITTALAARTGIDHSTCRTLLLGESALGNGPVRMSLRVPYRYDVVEKTRQAKVEIPPNLPRFATVDYLTHHTSEIEQVMLSELNVSPLQVMERSSYEKSFAEDVVQFSKVTLRRSNFCGRGAPTVGISTASLVRLEPLKGVLSAYPLLYMYRSQITAPMLTRLLRRLSIEPQADVMTQAWGGEARGVVVSGYMPRSDAMLFSSRTAAVSITVSRAVHA